MEEKQWFLYVADHHEGPYTIDEIRGIVKKGEARTTSYVWREGMEDWAMMSDVGDFGQDGPASGEGHGAPSFMFWKKKKPEPLAEGPATPEDVAENEPAIASEPAASPVSLMGVKPGDALFCLNSRRAFSGPHSIKTIVRKVNEGAASVKDTIWMEGWSHFVPIESMPEIMKDVKGSVLNPDLALSGKKGKSTKAMGLQGGTSVPRLRVWRSKVFLVFLVVAAFGGYQMASKGMIPGIQGGTLPALPVDALFDGAIKGAASAPQLLAPVADAVSEYLPEFVQEWFSPIEAIDSMPPEKMKDLRAAARTSLSQGAALSVALALGDEFNPVFHIGTNLPDGTALVVELRGKAGTLLNAVSYQKTVGVDVMKRYAKTLRFAHEVSKPVPRGEYILLVYEADKQTPEVDAVLKALPRKNIVSSMVPKGKAVVSFETLFLGGRKDAIYKQKLDEFNAKLAEKKAAEASELSQVIGLLESNAAEDRAKMRQLASVRAPAQRLALWRQHHGRMQQMATQLKASLDKGKDALEKDYVLGELYVRVGELIALWAAYHAEANAAMEAKPGAAPPAATAMTPMQAAEGRFAAAAQALKTRLATESPK